LQAKLFIAECLYVKETLQKGFGIFTLENIEANTIIELSPVIVMPKKDKTLLDQTNLYYYIFDWGDDTNECAMAMGYVPIYNHSYNSNCEYYMNFDEKTMFIQTVRDIKAEEELTINYNGTWNNEKPVWFEVIN
jgi:uncharacterized protein